ncbi:insulin-like peptide 1 [Haematobia irritans]|uniref:insulin-like peptide 1 n=1 Tax=Haematobia irritans TaxID=7368 RepID=UPI003F501EF4
MKLLSVLIIFVVIYEIHCDGSRFCGPYLAQVLEMVCVNGYNGLSLNKRSGSKHLHQDLSILDKMNEIDDDTTIKSDSLLNALLFGDHANTLAKTRRHRQASGVYYECCLKACTTDELAGYCL